MHRPDPPETPPQQQRVNFFRPLRGFMRGEVIIISVTLTAWALLTFGFPLYLAFCPLARLTGRTIFGMPLHYWFSGQFLIFWFILVSFVFNLLRDRLTENHRRHRQGGA